MCKIRFAKVGTFPFVCTGGLIMAMGDMISYLLLRLTHYSALEVTLTLHGKEATMEDTMSRHELRGYSYDPLSQYSIGGGRDGMEKH